MENLQINLFGTIELRFNSEYLFVFPTKKCEAVFVYLILAQGKRVQREVIAAEFWPKLPPPCGRRALNSDVWRLRRLLQKSGLDPEKVLFVTHEILAFKPAIDFSVDVFDFEQGLCGVDALDPLTAEADQIERIENILHLYRGDLCEGCYDDWCVVTREVLRAKRFAALEFLLRYNLHHHDLSKALNLANQLLVLDPLMEHIHRAIMVCYNLMGNRPAAVMHYKSCARLLKKELGIDPMPETQRLYQVILQGAEQIDLDPHSITVLPAHKHWHASSPVSTLAG